MISESDIKLLQEAYRIIEDLKPLINDLKNEDDRWLGTIGCARRLGISVATLRTKLWAWQKGKLDRAAPIGTDITPFHPPGADWRFLKKNIDDHIRKYKVG